MISNAQVIFDNDKPAFVVLRYEDYLRLTTGKRSHQSGNDELVPFEIGNYIKNPIRVMRIKAGLNQQQLARLLGVTQGYVSRIESRNFQVQEQILTKIRSAIHRPGKRKNRQ